MGRPYQIGRVLTWPLQVVGYNWETDGSPQSLVGAVRRRARAGGAGERRHGSTAERRPRRSFARAGEDGGAVAEPRQAAAPPARARRLPAAARRLLRGDRLAAAGHEAGGDAVAVRPVLRLDPADRRQQDEPPAGRGCAHPRARAELPRAGRVPLDDVEQVDRRKRHDVVRRRGRDARSGWRRPASTSRPATRGR